MVFPVVSIMQQEISLQDKVTLTRAIMAIIDGWGMSSQDILTFLALPEKTPMRALRRYRESTPFPDTDAVYERLEHIIGIADALRTTYPHNPPMGALWLRKKNTKFNNTSPLHHMINEGLAGIIAVRSHLDCAYDWAMNP